MKKKFDINASQTKRVGMLALFGAFLEGCGGGGSAGNLISLNMSSPADFTEGSASEGDSVATVASIIDSLEGELSYSIDDTTNYDIDSETGAVTLTAAGAVLANADANADLPVFTVTATTTAGGSTASASDSVNPTVTGTNDPITFSMSSSASFTEGLAASGDVVATVASVNDPDGGAITYSIDDTTNYAINTSTGEVTLTAAGAALANTDVNADLPQFIVTAESAGDFGSTATDSVNPSVSGTNDPLTFTMSEPSASTAGSFSAGDVIATVVSAVDPDGGAITFTIDDAVNYAIDSNTGTVTLTAAGAALANAATDPDLPKFTVTATSAGTFGSSASVSLDPSVAITASGKAIKGPLEGAEVFADYNENGVWDANEPKTTTNADGTYDLDVAQSSTIIVNTLATTIDTSTGNLIGAGTVLKAPAGATVVSPTTTLLASGVDEDSLKAALGIPASVDLNSFDPFAAGADSTAALAYEKASITVFATVKAIQAAAEAAGAGSEAAFDAALSSVVELVSKVDEISSGASSVFEDTTLISQALESVSTQLAESDANFDDTAFDTVSSDVATATATVYTAVQTITDIQSDATSAVITVATETLSSQISSAVSDPENNSITLTDSDAFNDAAADVNLAPTDIVFSDDGIDFLENIASGTVIGSFSAVDPNSGDSADFEIVSGGDASSFTLTQDGVLKFVGTADYETKSSYSVTVKLTDGGGKTRTETFELSVVDVPEDSVITVGASDSVAEAVTEDAEEIELSTSGTLTVTDLDGGGTFNTSFGFDDENSDYPQSLGTFAITEAGVWSYKVDNTLTQIQQLGDGESIKEIFTVHSADGTDSQDITITINGADDVSVISGSESGTVTEGTSVVASGTLVITDIDSNDTPSFVDISDGVVGDEGYGEFTITNGTWTYILNNDNSEVQALNVGESLTDTITFTATDGSEKQVSVTINGVDGVSDTFNLSSGLATLTDYAAGLDIEGVQYVSLDEVQVLDSTTYSLQVAGDQTFFLDRANLASGFGTDGFLGFDSVLQFDLSSVAVGSGTGTVNISLLDGENALRAQSERELIITLDVSWSTDASGTSLTVDSARDFWSESTGLNTEGVPVNTFTGIVINDDLNGANVDNQNSNVFEFTFDQLSPADIISSDGSVLTIELAPALALIDTLTYTVASVEEKVFDLTSQDGYYFFSIETDIPLVSSTGNSIESIQGALDIIEVASDTDLDPYEAYLTTEVVIAGDEGSNQLDSSAAASEVMIGFGGNDYFKLTVENGSANDSDIDLIVDYTDNLNETDGIFILSDNGADIDKADVAITEAQGSSVITYDNGSEVVYLALVEGVTGLTTEDLLVASDLV